MSRSILITGGAGFIGSHAAEHYSRFNNVIVIDNLSREKLLGRKIKGANFNWKSLDNNPKIRLVNDDITNFENLNKHMKGIDTVIHAAAQTAVTTSVIDPMEDFKNNVIGTFNVLESARRNDVKNIIYCSTNKVYGENVNTIDVVEGDKRYSFEGKYKEGVPEDFSLDHCEHTPYGCSKLTGDLYSQDYARLYGLKVGVFRMSCIYGTRQFGVEDQGWVAWFTIATITKKPITIYGDGKQVRDVLFVDDVIQAYDTFLNSKLKHGVFNLGGGTKNSLSLIELMDLLEKYSGKRSSVKYEDWRPSDQKVFIADITKVKNALGWAPKIGVEEGVKRLADWVEQNKGLFNQ